MTDKLKELYSNSSNEIYYDTIALSHSGFTNTWYFISTPSNKLLKLSNGTQVLFKQLGFDIILPTIGSNQQDMQIVLDNTDLILIKELNKAALNIKEPIILTHNMYIEGLDTPQSTDITLSLSNITYNNNQLSATATSSDTIGKSILKPLFDNKYKGLFYND